MPTFKSPFIVIEALDAGGSQTQTNRLASRLRREGYRAHQFHFPHEDRATGRLIYQKFLYHQGSQRALNQKGKAITGTKFSSREQALLYIQDFFSRSEDIAAIRSLRTGKHVIVSDRFYTSTLAYQTIGLAGVRRQKMLDWINWLCRIGEPSLPRPDLVIFLDTPVSISLGHLNKGKRDFFENRRKLTAIRRSYLRLAKEEKWTLIDGVDKDGRQRTIPDIHQEVWHHVKKTLGAH